MVWLTPPFSDLEPHVATPGSAPFRKIIVLLSYWRRVHDREYTSEVMLLHAVFHANFEAKKIAAFENFANKKIATFNLNSKTQFSNPIKWIWASQIIQKTEKKLKYQRK